MFLKPLATDASLLAYAPPSLCRIDGDGGGDDGFGGGLSIDAIADDIVAKLSDEPGEGDPAAGAAGDTQDPAGDGGDGAPDEDQPSADDNGTQADPSAGTPIEPPPSWSKEHKERWANLPRETQDYIHSREKERDAEVRRSQNEAAETRKAIEPERAALAQERQRYADQLNTYVTLTEALDPIISEGRKTDWAKLAEEDPAGAQAKWHRYNSRVGELAAAVQQRDQLVAQHMQQHFANEGRALVEKVTEWGGDLEKAKAGIEGLRKGAVDRYGFKPDEVTVIRDHRIALMLKDALAFHDLQASQAKEKSERDAAAKAAQQKRETAAPRLAPSSVPNAGNQRSDSKALRQRAKDPSRSLEDRAEDVLAMLVS